MFMVGEEKTKKFLKKEIFASYNDSNEIIVPLF